MRDLINLIEEAQLLNLKDLMAQYNTTVAKMVEDGKNGVYYNADNNPLSGIVHAINHLSAENNTPNPLMGMEVSTGRDTGVVLPSPGDKAIAMVRRKTTGQVAMADDIWVPKRYGKFVAPQNTYVKPKPPKRNIPPNLPDAMNVKKELFSDSENHVYIYCTFGYGEDYKIIVKGIGSPLDWARSNVGGRKRARLLWAEMGRKGKPFVEPSTIINALKKLSKIAPVYLYDYHLAKHDMWNHLKEWGVSPEQLIADGVITGMTSDH